MKNRPVLGLAFCLELLSAPLPLAFLAAQVSPMSSANSLGYLGNRRIHLMVVLVSSDHMAGVEEAAGTEGNSFPVTQVLAAEFPVLGLAPVRSLDSPDAGCSQEEEAISCSSRGMSLSLEDSKSSWS